MGRPLKIAKAHAVITLTNTTAATDIVTTSANLNTLGIIAGMPFIPAANLGNLVAGTTYWILEVLSSTTFTVSETQLSANPTYAKFDLATDSGTVAASVGVVDAYFNNPNGGAGYPATNANTYSVVGGNTAIYGSQVLANVCITQSGAGTISTFTGNTAVVGVGTDFTNAFSAGTIVYSAAGNILGTISTVANATSAAFAANGTEATAGVAYLYGKPEAGFIVRQKGKQKYLVTGATSGLTGPCYTANVANTALLPNTMTITATYANAATVNVQSLSDHTAELFTANSGPVATGNIVLSDANPAYSTFNTAYAADTYGGQPYPIVTIGNA